MVAHTFIWSLLPLLLPLDCAAALALMMSCPVRSCWLRRPGLWTRDTPMCRLVCKTAGKGATESDSVIPEVVSGVLMPVIRFQARASVKLCASLTSLVLSTTQAPHQKGLYSRWYACDVAADFDHVSTDMHVCLYRPPLLSSRRARSACRLVAIWSRRWKLQ